jgi:hypothetical protein
VARAFFVPLAGEKIMLVVTTFELINAAKKHARKRRYSRAVIAENAARKAAGEADTALTAAKVNKQECSKKVEKLQTNNTSVLVEHSKAAIKAEMAVEEATRNFNSANDEFAQRNAETIRAADMLAQRPGAMSAILWKILKLATDVTAALAIGAPETFGRYREFLVGLSELARTTL